MPPLYANGDIAKNHELLRAALAGPDIPRLGQTPADATPAETYISGNSVIIDLEAPGLVAKDFEVRVGAGLLTVVTTKQPNRLGGAVLPTWSERPFGVFTRTFPLPPGAKVQNIKGSYKDGFLRLTIPVKGAAGGAGRKITVT